MFEKEAEDNKPPYAFCALDTKCELWKDGFQKGAEFGYNKGKEELKKQLTEEQNLNAEIKARFVKCNTCTKEMKKDCLMWTENLCEGERCNELIDIQELIMKGGMIS